MSDYQKSPADKVKLPGVGIMVVGILGIVNAIYSTLDVLFGFSAAFLESSEMPTEVRQMLAAGSSYGLVFVAINFIGSCFLIWASLRMLKLKGHTAALVASILAAVPCWGGCCCLGLPVGIWALIVLLKADVKAAFDQNG